MLLGAERLSTRQLEVISLLTKGLARKQVAVSLGISINTVKAHAKAAFKKLGAVNCAQAVANYYRAPESIPPVASTRSGTRSAFASSAPP
jgi:DNA-binding CsgD family transcriptional regulator